MKFIAVILIALSFSSCGSKQIDNNSKKPEITPNTFQLLNPDYKLSPYTGMTRKHWLDAAQYLLEGAFSYIHNIDDPMKFPKQPGKTYPQNDGQIPTEKLEGLCRTLFVAAPLLRENPDLEINGIKVAEYYRHQLLNLTDPNSPSYIKHRDKNGGPSQILVEFGALSISLFVAEDIIWKPLTKEQQDKVASMMLSYGDGPTVDSNWKFFNIFVLSFFKSNGYDINEKLLKEYLSKSLKDYRGDGWYNDHPAYDYYSMWAYQLYGIMWSEMVGNKNYPEYAAQFTNNFKDMLKSYPYMFARDGRMVMWGRSISYRMGAIAPFPFFGTVEGANANLGWLRHIASGTILQFLQNPNFLKDNVPTLGFYGAYEPAVQIYSCRGSVYWMGKAFLGLLIPADNPFWTVTENEGPWENEMLKDSVYNHLAPNTSGLMITDYPNIGGTEIRSWCHEKVSSDWQKFRSTENYNRLAYSSEFPWQADGDSGQVAMNYVFKNKNNQWEAFRLFTFKQFEDGAYYRDAVLETDEHIKMQLAEIPIPNGVLRVDKYIGDKAIEARLGHYALPRLNEDIKTFSRESNGMKAIIIDNGVYQLAMVNLKGWDKMEVVNTKGLHPQSENSSVIDATATFRSTTDDIYACLMLWRKSGEKWTDKELFPIKSIEANKSGVLVNFQNKKEKIITFK